MSFLVTLLLHFITLQIIQKGAGGGGVRIPTPSRSAHGNIPYTFTNYTFVSLSRDLARDLTIAGNRQKFQRYDFAKMIRVLTTVK
jgi:hypothetical protein